MRVPGPGSATIRAHGLLVRWARADAARGRRCSIGFYAELLRRPEWWTGRGCCRRTVPSATTPFGPAWCASSSREHAELADAFETRRSRAGVTLDGSDVPSFKPVSPRVWDERWSQRDARSAVALLLTNRANRLAEGLYRLPKGYIKTQPALKHKRSRPVFAELLRRAVVRSTTKTPGSSAAGRGAGLPGARQPELPEGGAAQTRRAAGQRRLLGELLTSAESLCPSFCRTVAGTVRATVGRVAPLSQLQLQLQLQRKPLQLAQAPAAPAELQGCLRGLLVGCPNSSNIRRSSVRAGLGCPT